MKTLNPKRKNLLKNSVKKSKFLLNKSELDTKLTTL